MKDAARFPNGPVTLNETQDKFIVAPSIYLELQKVVWNSLMNDISFMARLEDFPMHKYQKRVVAVGAWPLMK